MKRSGKKSDVLSLIVDWQDTETETIEYATKQLPKAKNSLTRTMLKLLKLEAEKRWLIQQLIVESINKEAIQLSPEELGDLSAHINKSIEAEENVLGHVDGQDEMTELFVTRSLFSYLTSGLKKENELLRQFDDELKTASIPTSVTSRKFHTEKSAA